MIATLSLDKYEAVHIFESSLDREDFLNFIVTADSENLVLHHFSKKNIG